MVRGERPWEIWIHICLFVQLNSQRRLFLVINFLSPVLNMPFYGDNTMQHIEIPSIYMKHELLRKFQRRY